MVQEIADLFEDEKLRHQYLESTAGKLGSAALCAAAEAGRGVSYRR